MADRGLQRATWLIWLLSATILSAAAAENLLPLNLDCDPCIRRPDFVVEAIVHGTAGDPYWQMAQAALEQAARDMNVQFRMTLYDHFDPLQQRDDILAAAAAASSSNKRRLDALIVTLPSPQIHDAVRQAVQAGIPVFGFNAGYNVFDELGVLGFAAQDEYMAGSMAAREFLSLLEQEAADAENSSVFNMTTSNNITTEISGSATGSSSSTRALFINHEKGNQAVDERFRGFNETLLSSNRNATVEELSIDSTDPNLPVIIDRLLQDCPFDIILAAGIIPAPHLVEAATRYGCYPRLKMATFDIVDNLQRYILQDQLQFCLSQQKHLQATWPLIMAVIYATTSKAIIQQPGDTKTLLSGPIIINKDNLPSDTLTSCQEEAFPICPNDLAPNGLPARCDCFHRNKIRIGGVLHGAVTDKFWDPVYLSAQQAALDMGVQLENARFTETDREILYNKMAAQMKTLCESNVDGIFVTIPDRQPIKDAVKVCLLLNIPVIAVNSDPRISEELGVLQHIGQDEWRAGYLAGQRAIEAGVQEGYCTAPPGNSGSTARCVGFIDAINDMGGNGTVIVPPFDNLDVAVTFHVEQAVQRDDDWDGVGVLIGASGLPHYLGLQKERSGLRIGMFDLGKDPELVYSALDNGTLLFTADQQPYLQGNLPVYLLTYMAYTQERLLDKLILTGPGFITARPIPAQQICEINSHAVCSLIPEEDMTYLSPGVVGVGSFFTALTVFTGLICLVWLYVYRKRSIVYRSQPPFLVMLVFGAIVQSLAIIPMGIETGYRISKDPFTGNITGSNPDVAKVDAACMAVPWLYGLGFVLMFAALFAKIWRIKLLFQAALQMKKRTVGYQDVTFILAAMFVIELALLVSWQIVSPHRWERVVTEYSYEGYALESVGHCESESGWYFMAAIVGFHILCLFYALILCWQAKHIPSEFADSNSVSLSVVMVFQISILAIPIAAMVQEEERSDVFYFVRACALFLQSFTVLCLIFVPKIYKTLKGPEDEAKKRISSHPLWNTPKKSSRPFEKEVSEMMGNSGKSSQPDHNNVSSEFMEMAPLLVSSCCNAEVRGLCSSCGGVCLEVAKLEHVKGHARKRKEDELPKDLDLFEPQEDVEQKQVNFEDDFRRSVLNDKEKESPHVNVEQTRINFVEDFERSVLNSKEKDPSQENATQQKGRRRAVDSKTKEPPNKESEETKDDIEQTYRGRQTCRGKPICRGSSVPDIIDKESSQEGSEKANVKDDNIEDDLQHRRRSSDVASGKVRSSGPMSFWRSKTR